MLNRRDFLALSAATGAYATSGLIGQARADAAPLQVVTSSTFRAALETLLPQFQAATGIKATILIGPSMGTTTDAIPMRLQRGENLDVLIMIGAALEDLIKQGKVLPDSKAVLASSGIGVIVKAGAPHPDISTPEALKAALIAAKSVGWSDSASGVYIQNKMLPKLGLSDIVGGKGKMIPADPVGLSVAKGDIELGFQQLSELKPIKGIDILGPLPADLQLTSLVAAGVLATSTSAEAGRKLIAFLASHEASKIIADTGLEPLTK